MLKKPDIHQHQDEESIDYLISNIPLILDNKDTNVKEVGMYYLPFSVGIEIECDQKATFNEEIFKDIPNIMHVQCDNSEQRFRIPNGIQGLQCLYEITENLIEFCNLNIKSGIHYHIDCTDFYDKINDKFVEDKEQEMLLELDKWCYKGTYNHRSIKFRAGHTWIRFQDSFKTMEFRIGEMTFDYKLLFNRIIHASTIVNNFKDYVEYEHECIHNPVIKYLSEDMKQILLNRIEKI